MNRLNKFLFFLVLFSLSLNEFYHERIGRIFDYLSIILILVFFIINFKNVSFKKSEFSIYFFFLPFVIVGFMSFQFLPSLAVLFGITVIGLFFKFCVRIDKIEISKIVDIVLYIHVTALIIQMLAFYVFNIPFSYIDFFPGLQVSRTYNEGLNFLRPGGFMMEPNSYSANIFMMTFISYKIKGTLSDAARIALCTVPLTLSLWGIFVSIVILFLFVKPVYKIVLIFFLALSLVFFFNYFNDTITLIRISRIIEDPSSDNSIVTRLGLDSNHKLNPFNLIFGNGINSVDFQAFFGGNGFSYMFFCFGIFGTFFFLLWFYISNGLRFFILFLLFNITFPYFSYLIFWAFLAIAMKNITVNNKFHPIDFMNKKFN